MTQSDDTSDLPRLPALEARRHAATRTIIALMLREMSTSYGRSALGYLWAILEPVAGVMLLTFLFSFAFNSPPIGHHFGLFYASGVLPFLAYMDVSQKISVSLRYSQPLMSYPGVTFFDALMARFIINSLTQVMVFVVVFACLFGIYKLNATFDVPKLALGFAMTFALALGVGTLNCFLLSSYPLWERIWAVLNRPLFIVSCVFFLFTSIPEPFRSWLWWNPIVHLIGQVRSGIYPTYDAHYVSPFYVFMVSGVTFALGLLLLRRYHRDIVNR